MMWEWCCCCSIGSRNSKSSRTTRRTARTHARSARPEGALSVWVGVGEGVSQACGAAAHVDRLEHHRRPTQVGFGLSESQLVRSATDPACQRPRCQSINQSNEFDGTHTRLWGEGPQPRALELLGAGKINVEMCGVVPSRFEVRAERRPRRAAKRLSLAHTYPLFLGAGRHPFSPGVCPGLASCVVQPGVLEGGMDG